MVLVFNSTQKELQMKYMLSSMLIFMACTLQSMEGNEAATCQRYNPEIEAYLCIQLKYLKRDNADQFSRIQAECSRPISQEFMQICQLQCWQRLASTNSDYFRSISKLDK